MSLEEAGANSGCPLYEPRRHRIRMLCGVQAICDGEHMSHYVIVS
jgi:hypothetical protein